MGISGKASAAVRCSAISRFARRATDPRPHRRIPRGRRRPARDIGTRRPVFHAFRGSCAGLRRCRYLLRDIGVRHHEAHAARDRRRQFQLLGFTAGGYGGSSRRYCWSSSDSMPSAGSTCCPRNSSNWASTSRQAPLPSRISCSGVKPDTSTFPRNSNLSSTCGRSASKQFSCPGRFSCSPRCARASPALADRYRRSRIVRAEHQQRSAPPRRRRLLLPTDAPGSR